jgi:MOSC domain-containing protein YiiM
VNVGLPRVTEWHGREVLSGIWKEPIDGRVAVRGVNVDGDAQADPRVHGGPDKAVYAYAVEDYAWWSEELHAELSPGTFGENLTVEGLDLGAMVIGSHWRIGTVTFEVAQPRLPCFKLGMRMGDSAFVDEFERAERFGAYLRIVEEGHVGAGDAIHFMPIDRVGITVRELGAAGNDPPPRLLDRIVADALVPESWHDWARRRIDRSAG